MVLYAIYAARVCVLKSSKTWHEKKKKKKIGAKKAT